MTVVVTGAGGFVGRRLLLRLVREGHDVIAAVRGVWGLPGLEGTLPDLRFVPWAAGESLPLRGVDVVIHAAAHRPVRYDDPTEAEACYRVNALASGQLAHAAAEAGVHRFVYLSTSAYRPLPRPAREDDPVWPARRASAYQGSKLAGEWLVEAASPRIEVTIVRPSAIYGRDMKPGLVRAVVERLRAGQEVVIGDGGRFTTDLVFVDDVVDGIARAVKREVSGTFNLGSGEPITSLQLAEVVADALGRPRSLIRVEPPSGEPASASVLDVTRAREALGWSPRSLRDGLAEML
jgi:UDP-glucose 4-epimerase